MRKRQAGIMLLEALIAILIFSLGILGVVAMQATAVKANRDAKYRTDAGLLANELVGQMMSGNRDGATLKTNFQGDDDDALGTSAVTDGQQFLQWRARVREALPGSAQNDPRVTIDPGVAGSPKTSSTVTIVVRWMPPNTAVVHSYTLVVEVI